MLRFRGRALCASRRNPCLVETGLKPVHCFLSTFFPPTGGSPNSAHVLGVLDVLDIRELMTSPSQNLSKPKLCMLKSEIPNPEPYHSKS